MITIPIQRTSRKKKENPDWYIPTMEYWIDVAKRQDKTSVKEALQYSSGQIDIKKYLKVLLPFSNDKEINLDEFLNKIPDQITDGDFITPIKEKTIADYINLPYKPQVLVNNPQASLKRDTELKQKLAGIYEQMYINLVNKSLESQNQEDPAVPSKPIPDIKEFAEQFIKEWVDDKAIKNNNILNLIRTEMDFDTLRYEAFMYWWACEEFYTYRYIRGNKVCCDIINPVHAYPISNGSSFVEDYDGFLISDTITWGTFRDIYYDFLKPEDQKIIDKVIDNTEFSSGGVFNIPPNDVEFRIEHSILKSMFGETNKPFINSDKTLSRNIIIFKTEVEVYTLVRINALGEIENVEVQEGYILDVLNGDIDVIKSYRREVYVGYRFGSGVSSIYIAPISNPVQQYDKDTNTCKLPVGGKRGIFPGIPQKPIPSRIAVNLALDRFYQYIINKELATYKAYMEIIPKSMLQEDETGTLKEKYLYRLLDKTIIYDETKISPQEIQYGYKIHNNFGLEKYLDMLMRLKEANKQEAFAYSHMNSDRFGDIDTRSAVTNVNNNILRAKLGMILMVYMFNETMVREHIAQLEYAKVAYNKGKSGHFKDANNIPTFIEINPDDLIDISNVIFIENSMKSDEKLIQYKNLAQALGQNDPELAAIAIDSDNTIEIRRKIEEVSKMRREFEQSQNEMANNAKLEAAQIASQIKDKDNEIKLAIAQLHEENENYRTQLKTNPNVSNEAINNIQDKINKLMLDRENLSIKQGNLNELINNNRAVNEIKRLQIASNERIAKAKNKSAANRNKK